MDALDFTAKPTILVVDDTPDNLSLMSGLLEEEYEVKIAINGAKALKIVAESPPDLILLDIMMPVMDGYEVCRQLKADPAATHIPVIFLTAKSEVEDEEKGLEMGAVDYITKPISPPILLARVKTQLNLKASADFLRDKNEFFEQEVERRTREVVAIQDAAIMTLAALAETRDTETANHIRRSQYYFKALAEKLNTNPSFAGQFNNPTIAVLSKAAALHDIGKVGIPEHILFKPGRLDPEEFEIIKKHAALGRDAVLYAERTLGAAAHVDYFSAARDMAYCHHEKWDGSGYPRGLSGTTIPVSARLMALADVYDALISRRVYKDPVAHEEAVRIIGDGRGRHFDPDVVDAFVAIEGQFAAIANLFKDVQTDDGKDDLDFSSIENS
ncbi:MAG: response regulator [Proteobacteria bacterium]|nr:response regulator [Pseudomonadota bacterium]